MSKLKLLFCLSLFVSLDGVAQTVTLDYYFNREVHKGKDGLQRRFHYMWEDSTNAGFSIWGRYFKSAGGKLDSLPVAPTLTNLKYSSIYIIVDPDSKKESPKPNYITETDANNIAAWVKQGGILVMMANDSANVELEHFNILAAKFGLHFNNDLQNHVIDDKHFEDGKANISNKDIFKTTNQVYLKDACSISSTGNAKTALSSPNNIPIAVAAKYGKGTVFAVGDPWLYNEYVNGRLPSTFENDKAAGDLAKWLLSKAKK